MLGLIIAIAAALPEKDRAAARVERKRRPTEAEAKALAQRLIAQQYRVVARKRLHDPDSAKLPDALSEADDPQQLYVGERKPGTLSIQFEMRAKNAFGALRAHDVTCMFKATKEGYALAALMACEPAGVICFSNSGPN